MGINQTEPLVSFCIFTYNQENYIKDAIEGAITQDYCNMEIIISDDCSTDKTFNIIETFKNTYKGKHKIIINKNAQNLGIREHYNKVIYDIAKGDIIVVAAGDDVSLPERTRVTVEFFKLNSQVKSVHFRSLQVDKNLDILENMNSTICEGQNTILTLDDYLKTNLWLYSGDSRAFTRELIEKYPRLAVSRNEDLPSFIRAIMLGPTAVIRQGLVLRRIDGNNTSSQYRFKQEGRDLQRQLIIDIDYALEKQYIDKTTHGLLKKKILNIIADMMLKDLDRLCPFIVKLYKCAIVFPRYIAKII